MLTNLEGRKILVTGGAGFVGSHLCDLLIKEKATVSIIDDLSTGHRTNLNPKAEFFQFSINNPSELENYFKKIKPEIIFHLAFNTSVPKSVQNPLIEEDSLIGSIRLFDSAKKHGVKKVIFSSSEFIYGNTLIFPIPETTPVDPLAPYSISKNTIENYLLYYHKNQGLPSVVLRYATVYGPRQSLGALTDYIRQLSQDKQADIWGDGSKTREYIYVEDVVRATVLALKIPDNHANPVFNVGTGVETTLLTLYKQIAAILKKDAKPVFHTDRPGEQMRCLLNSDKFRKELDWTARTSLEAGLKIKIDDFLKNPS